MATACPICEQPTDRDLPSCTTCGFPTALQEAGRRALAEPQPPVPPRGEAKTATPARPARSAVSAAPGPEEEMCAKVARDIEANLSFLHRLGGETNDITSEMRQAALTEVDGRATEALGILRSAQARVVRRTRELFEQRVTDVEHRQAALRGEGVGVDLSGSIEEVRAALGANRRAEALDLLSRADQRLSRAEGDWRGLKGLLAQIETLRSAHQSVEEVTAEIDESVREVQSILAQKSLTDQQLDDASKTAARALMLLHEGLPARIEEELERHASLLSVYPDDHPAGRAARALHDESLRQLRRGRLTESTAALQKLRSAILEMSGSARPPPAPRADENAEGEDDDRRTSAGSVTDNSQEALARLLKRARGLAARVRTLPPESELAFEAAGEIRRATELLRAHNLEDAESTLTRLMRTLDAERTEAV